MDHSHQTNVSCNRTMDQEAEQRVEAILDSTGRWHWWVSVQLSLTKIPLIWSLVSFFFLAPKVSYHCSGCPSSTCSDCEGLPCTSWNYSTKPFTSTIISEWDLVCERAPLVNLTQVVFMVGVFLGCAPFGVLSDRRGRKPIVIVTGMGFAIGGILASRVQTFSWFLGIRFVQGLFIGGNVASVHVMCLEVLSHKTRSTLGMCPHLGVYLGTSLAALLAFATEDWRQCLLAFSIPALLHGIYIWSIPESPRWLLAAGRKKEALAIVDRVQVFNKISERKIQEKIGELQMLKERVPELERPSTWDLMRQPTLRWRTLNLWTSFLVASICFFGLNQFLTRIGDDLFINMGISGVVSGAGCVGAMFLIERIGRRPVQAMALFLVALSSVLLAALPPGEDKLVGKAVLGVIGVVASSVAFMTVFLYSAELFPTQLRNWSMGLSAAVARLGTFSAPYVISLGSVAEWAPTALFAVLSLLVGILTLFLPETMGRSLPQTLDDAVAIPYSWKRKTPRAPGCDLPIHTVISYSSDTLERNKT